MSLLSENIDEVATGFSKFNSVLLEHPNCSGSELHLVFSQLQELLKPELTLPNLARAQHLWNNVSKHTLTDASFFSTKFGQKVSVKVTEFLQDGKRFEVHHKQQLSKEPASDQARGRTKGRERLSEADGASI